MVRVIRYWCPSGFCGKRVTYCRLGYHRYSYVCSACGKQYTKQEVLYG